MSEISNLLPQLKNKDIFLYLNKENPDWTSDEPNLGLTIHFEGKKATVPFNQEKNRLYFASSLHHFISDKSIVISWSAKDIFSYLKGKTGINLDLKNTIYDLQIISSYFDFDEEKPNSFNKAIDIFKKALKEPDWNRFLNFYNKIHMPLITRVLPEIETNCLVDNDKKTCVYPTYVLEGQANGRLKAVKINEYSYNPHSIGNNEKINLRPRDYDEVFVYFDYKNMEVNVLQWLSNDEELEDILNSNKDLYKQIWGKITKQEPTENHRAICKSVFLPVVFGQGRKSLSKKIGVSEEIASKIIDSLVRSFPVAFDWVNSQSLDGNNKATDVFGRKRAFKDHEQYKVKNFCIQSPASMICLRKLVKLHDALADKASICFHVHDGYCVLCKKNNASMVSEIGIKVLEEEDDLFPGLKLKTTCNFGNNLNNLKQLKNEVLV